jgi:hypothetical protein
MVDTYAESKTSMVLARLNQRLVALSDDNKRELLSDASQLMHSDHGQAQAAAIISRLQALNPDVAHHFGSKPQANPRLRMILPAPQSESEHTDNHIRAYIIVSYCWHYPAWPLPPAATPLTAGWKISEPMMEAVMALRNTGEGVWLDQLCINQDDRSDQQAHIGTMDIIYRSARRLAILLEDIQLDEEDEAAGLAYAGFFEDLVLEVKNTGVTGEERTRLIEGYFPSREREFREKGKGHILAAASRFLTKLLGARWFSRAWCRIPLLNPASSFGNYS